jgi:hypothetical protein
MMMMMMRKTSFTRIRLGELVTLLFACVTLACAPPAEQGAGPATAPASTAAPPADTSFFAGGPGYASSPVANSAAAAHLAKKVSVSMPAVPACLKCHRGGGHGTPFVFAGTAFTDKAATRGASDIEIRVVDARGTAMTAHTDADGNFWVKGGAQLAKPARAGARNAQAVRVQQSAITNGDCNSCHTAETPLVF